MPPVRPIEVRGSVLTVAGADMLDGTPRYDIEPYVPAFGALPDSRAGWFDAVKGNVTAAGLSAAVNRRNNHPDAGGIGLNRTSCRPRTLSRAPPAGPGHQ
jgi:tRNA (Thr-GGU) A37 N-methylase